MKEEIGIKFKDPKNIKVVGNTFYHCGDSVPIEVSSWTLFKLWFSDVWWAILLAGLFLGIEILFFRFLRG